MVPGGFRKLDVLFLTVAIVRGLCRHAHAADAPCFPSAILPSPVVKDVHEDATCFPRPPLALTCSLSLARVRHDAVAVARASPPLESP